MKGRIIPCETLEGFYDETYVQEVSSFIDNNLTGSKISKDNRGWLRGYSRSAHSSEIFMTSKVNMEEGLSKGKQHQMQINGRRSENREVSNLNMMKCTFKTSNIKNKGLSLKPSAEM